MHQPIIQTGNTVITRRKTRKASTAPRIIPTLRPIIQTWPVQVN